MNALFSFCISMTTNIHLPCNIRYVKHLFKKVFIAFCPCQVYIPLWMLRWRFLSIIKRDNDLLISNTYKNTNMLSQTKMLLRLPMLQYYIPAGYILFFDGGNIIKFMILYICNGFGLLNANWIVQKLIRSIYSTTISMFYYA